jgi:hypothetical protein
LKKLPKVQLSEKLSIESGKFPHPAQQAERTETLDAQQVPAATFEESSSSAGRAEWFWIVSKKSNS